MQFVWIRINDFGVQTLIFFLDKRGIGSSFFSSSPYITLDIRTVKVQIFVEKVYGWGRFFQRFSFHACSRFAAILSIILMDHGMQYSEGQLISEQLALLKICSQESFSPFFTCMHLLNA